MPSLQLDDWLVKAQPEVDHRPATDNRPSAAKFIIIQVILCNPATELAYLHFLILNGRLGVFFAGIQYRVPPAGE